MRAPAGSGAILLTTKLHPPPARAEHIGRSRLVGRLRAGAGCRLSLVVAPAGWGKTTLLAQWLAVDGAGTATAWLSLDESDNDPVRFFSYLIAALRTVDPALGTNSEATLRAPGAPIAEVALPLLINELALRSEEIQLVLDDYHVIDNEDVHEGFAFLVEHAPSTLRLSLGCRYDPPLPLARWRARGELSEVRAGDLSFTGEEATSFLNESLTLQLAAEEIDSLLERTEGWAAGLYLAALSFQSMGPAPGSARASVSGEDRHLIDYFTAEVLDRQPDELRAFLLRTSVLERLSGPLCDSLTDHHDGAETLEQLERSNLFLVPLDNKREWYRYHQLFRELLRHELHRADPDLPPELHRRANAWYREAGEIPEAIGHATQACEFGAASDMIAQHWAAFTNAGQLATIINWLEALPEEVVKEDARLCVAAAMVWSELGRGDKSDRWLDAASHAPLPGPILDGLSSVESGVAIIRAIRLRLDGDIGQATAVARDAVEFESDGIPPWRAVASVVLGMSLYWGGQGEDARPHLEETLSIGHELGDAISVVVALGYLAALDLAAGDPASAERLARRGIELAQDTRNAEHHAPTLAHLALGEVLEAQGHLADAETQLRRAAELSQRRSDAIGLACGLAALARVRHGRGDPDEARELLRDAQETLNGCTDPGIVATRLEESERQLCHTQKRRAASAPGRYEELSDRELTVLRLLASELSRREIASELYVSHNTMKSHIRTIYRKLDVNAREQAVVRARELDLL